MLVNSSFSSTSDKNASLFLLTSPIGYNKSNNAAFKIIKLKNSPSNTETPILIYQGMFDIEKMLIASFPT
jgi:hypothetical protein